MTPLPKPTTRGTRRMRADNPIPMTSAAYLRWRNKRPTPISMPAEAEVASGLKEIFGRPYWGDKIEAAGDGTPVDEVDAGYLAAVRMGPRKVGTGPGEVPMLVAHRLYDAGLIRKRK